MIKITDNSTQTLISTAQDFTALWADLGEVIDCRDVTKIGLWIHLDINLSVNARIRFVGLKTEDDTDEYVVAHVDYATTNLDVYNKYYEIDADADAKLFFPLEVDDLVPFAKIQIQAGTVGGTAAQIDEAYISFNKMEA